ncbi:response regulator transcription factor [Clostridium ganghwense]|uniref:Stage 0 sporulation protein A homolog n=1 Tax=Clostridium ganghwense TaxID=312089 RepID=A0ABT4CNI6_9CLOT|nr:response regulator transcription factor [Clostridium ganghwense]MCY6369631.1 response regulator transcription factor [Clostridium ganghwense]
MNNMNILLAEDDKDISNLIVKYLKKEGYSVDTAYDGEEALLKYYEREYNLIILDIMMPKFDGMVVMRKIREKSNIPIIILSAKSEEVDKVLGLDLGADDYVTKPFSIVEFIARVRAQLRRSTQFNNKEDKNDGFLVHGELKLDLNNYTVIKNEQVIQLTLKEFELLKFFFTEKNKVFTKAQLFNKVWHEDYMSDENTVMVHIRRLRTKIENNPSNPKYIQTVWGIGYKLGDDINE